MQCCKKLTHWSCIQFWFNESGSRSCPYCRTVQRDIPKIKKKKEIEPEAEDDVEEEMEWELDADRPEDKDYVPETEPVILERQYSLRLTPGRMDRLENGNIYH